VNKINKSGSNGNDGKTKVLSVRLPSQICEYIIESKISSQIQELIIDFVTQKDISYIEQKIEEHEQIITKYKKLKEETLIEQSNNQRQMEERNTKIFEMCMNRFKGTPTKSNKEYIGSVYNVTLKEIDNIIKEFGE